MMTGSHPPSWALPPRGRAVRLRAAQRPRFLHLCSHRGHSTGRDGIYTLKNYYLPLECFPIEAGGDCFFLSVEACLKEPLPVGMCWRDSSGLGTNLHFCVSLEKSLPL